MRKLLFLSICFCFIFVACNSGKVNNAEITIGNSTKFSEAEINQAIALVKTKFKDFRGCNLTKIWYDEEKYEAYVESETENTIILLSNFETDKSAISQGFNPNSNYVNWMWILIREDKSANWKVIDWGY